MTGHYDSLEIRDPAVRERELFAEMPATIAHAMSAPGWSRHLAGADAKAINSRAALAKLPV
ncbi:MAG TPA: phenylacetate--CoA ligase family protein, partial [Pseudolabrys sp.]|nr:phenylacetate--CoA ligase family protein [Pseudolabrys sp.]